MQHREACTKRRSVSLLGASLDKNSNCQDVSVVLDRSGQKGLHWRFILKKPILPPLPASPPPPPPAVVAVEVPVLNVQISFVNETVASFGSEKQQNLCKSLVSMSIYDPALVTCTVVRVRPAIDRRRTLLQSGIIADSQMTFRVTDASQVEAATQAAQQTSQDLQNPEMTSAVLGEGAQVDGVEETSETEVVPADPPEPEPEPEPQP